MWDVRNSKKPLWQNRDSKHCLMAADFFGDDCFIVATSIEGEIFIYGTERQKRVFTHETLPPMIKEWEENRRPIEEGFVDPTKKLTSDDVPPTNVIYTAKGLKNVPGEENCFLLGAQDTQIQKFRKSFNGVAVTDRFVGHSMGVRSLELSKDASMLLTGCDDHSLRVWDYKTGKADLIFAGHHDVVTGGIFVGPRTCVSSSWDMTIKVWEI